MILPSGAHKNITSCISKVIVKLTVDMRLKGAYREVFPAGVIGIFHWHNPSDHTMALESTQPLTEMSTRSISWRVKVAGV